MEQLENTDFFMSNKGAARGVAWREILIDQAVVASHHRIDEQTAAACICSCSYQNKLDLAED